MFQETRARHLRARNAADKGEESMTGMRFFVNLIPEAAKHTAHARGGQELHRDFLASPTAFSLFLSAYFGGCNGAESEG